METQYLNGFENNEKITTLYETLNKSIPMQEVIKCLTNGFRGYEKST